MSTRIKGYDFARALAIFGMVLVNFKIVMGSETGSDWLYTIVSLLEGRASALFVVLAGVGVSLTVAAKTDNTQRALLCKRGLLLIVLGLALSLIWPADILHFYGFYFLIAALFISAKNTVLLTLAVWVCITSFGLLLVFDYEKGWDFSSLTYIDFWTASGMLRHLIFNGFHPVLPWMAFIFIGMWLGRKDLRNTRVRRRILIGAACLWAGTELASKGVMLLLASSVPAGEDVLILLSTAMMPPVPLYLLAAASLAVCTICMSVELTERYPQAKGVRALTCTGQLALTFYMAHIFIGMSVMDVLGFIGQQSINMAVLFAVVFCSFSVLFAVVWKRHFSLGPIEAIFKKVVG